MPVIEPITCYAKKRKRKKKEEIFLHVGTWEGIRKKINFFFFFWFHSVLYPPLRCFWSSARSAEQWSVVWQVSPGGTAFKMSLCARKHRDWHLFPADILIHLSDEGMNRCVRGREFAFGWYLWLKLLPGTGHWGLAECLERRDHLPVIYDNLCSRMSI